MRTEHISEFARGSGYPWQYFSRQSLIRPLVHPSAKMTEKTTWRHDKLQQGVMSPPVGERHDNCPPPLLPPFPRPLSPALMCSSVINVSTVGRYSPAQWTTTLFVPSHRTRSTDSQFLSGNGNVEMSQLYLRSRSRIGPFGKGVREPGWKWLHTCNYILHYLLVWKA